MEDTIEICAGCGKMPRAVDRMNGYFLCSRCGCRATIHVTTDDYERIAADLDQKFHEKILSKKAQAVANEPLDIFLDDSKPEPESSMDFRDEPRPFVRPKPIIKVPVRSTISKTSPIKKIDSKPTKKKTSKKKAKKTVKKTKTIKKSAKKVIKKKIIKKKSMKKVANKKVKTSKKKSMKKTKKRR